MKILKISHIEEIAHRMAIRQMNWNEPIPDFGTRYPGKLESCLVQSFQTFGAKDLYPGIIKKASVIFYLMIKNHPFVNGNKRIAVATMITFLLINKKWLEVSNEELYEIAVWVAKSNPKVKDGVLLAIENFITRSIRIIK
ncbi:MAG: type II toxin-antitoxin system death-on-curing family toxin [Patescibacteria group bacterium]|nr:type II toxin-antitoxin system death-on-curing family toxin [Patescibacteria group bacterium]